MEKLSDKMRASNVTWRAHNELLSLYGEQDGEKLWALWHGRASATKRGNQEIRKNLHQSWLDHKVFAEYIVTLPNFVKWPEFQLDRIDNDLPYGYQEGNVRFVSQLENIKNTARTRKLVYEGEEYTFPDFANLVFGEANDTKPKEFLYRRIACRNFTVTEALNELYASRTKSLLWPSLKMRKHFTDWFESQHLLPPNSTSGL